MRTAGGTGAQRRLLRLWVLGTSLLGGLLTPGAVHALRAVERGGRPPPVVAGTSITNQAQASWQAGSGSVQMTTSNLSVVVVAQFAGVLIVPSRALTTVPGVSVFFEHTVTNTGNALDCLLLTATTSDGSPVRLHLLGPGEPASTAPSAPPVSACVPLASGGSFRIAVVVDVPATAPDGSTSQVTVDVQSGNDPALSAQVQDQIRVQLSTATLSLQKTADRASATLWDLVTYSIAYTVRGSGTAADVAITDLVPPGTAYLPGSLLLGTQSLTDADDNDAGRFDPAANAVVFELGDLTAPDAGVLSFQVMVNSAQSDSIIRNSATGGFGPSGTTTTVTSNSVATTFVTPEARLEKRLDSPNLAHIGEEVRYTILYSNSSAVPIRDAVVTDTLPVGLEYVSSVPAADVTGRVLHWSLGDIAPMDTVSIALTARVAQTVVDTLVALNRAIAASANGAGAQDTASEVVMVGLQGDELSIDNVAGLLEVAGGETIPYSIILTNTGLSALSGLVVVDSLPPGITFARSSVVGVDSLRVIGQVVSFFVSGPLPGGASHTIRYSAAVTAPQGNTLRNVAWATAEAGFVRSQTAASLVRVRNAWPMETRTALGRVWVDLDGDGRLGDGEPGVEGVDVWTADGEVVTTDEDGKFSFRNLRPGGHAFHLDVATLPMSLRLGQPEDELATLTADGWTSPRVTFRLVSRLARLAAVRLPASDRNETRQTDATRARPPWILAARALTAIQLVTLGERGASVANSPSVLAPDTLPDPSTLEPAELVEIALEPHGVGWPEVVYPLGPGWQVVPGSSRWGDETVPDPEVRRGRTGQNVLYWRLSGFRSSHLLRLRLSAGASPTAEPAPSIAALRTPEEREAERSREFLNGPGVEVFEPTDGAIYRRDRIYVGVRGEPNMPVALFDGDSLIAEATLRIDGEHDFVAVQLARGPHRLRVRMQNSWGNERWDSLAVHVTGVPAAFVAEPDPIRLMADGHSLVEVRIRVHDRWGVPVVDGPQVSVWAERAVALGDDVDDAAPGLQVEADSAGWLHLRLRPEKTSGQGSLVVRYGDVVQRIPVRILPELRSLIVTGLGRFGVGASPDAFAAITARGRLDDRTSVTVVYDSRRLDAGRDVFGRDYDPLGESRYTVPGDASQTRTLGASRRSFAARVERDMDWVAFGELPLDDFTSGLRLTNYRRALSGLQARVSTGPVTWRGFGSLTSQGIRQLQIRGVGTSGPYDLESESIRPGTERVVLETRDPLNAQRVLNQESLARFVDYQIDYETGTLLLNRPAPASDAYGNPLFILITYESDGGAEEVVAGVRASIDVDEFGRLPAVDSLRIGLTGLRGGGPDGGHYLTGADAQLKAGPVRLGVEIAHSTVSDSSGVAFGIDGSASLWDGGGRLEWRWTRIGERFVNPSDIVRTGGTEELHVGVSYGLGPLGQVRVSHDQQHFKRDGVRRSQTLVNVARSVGSDVEVTASIADNRFRSAAGRDEGRAGQLKLAWQATSDLRLWTEGHRQFSASDQLFRPDYVGIGTEYRLSQDVSIRATHRLAFVGGAETYSITEVGAQSAVGLGTSVRGSYQMVGGGDAVHTAAVVGLNNRLRLGNSWTINSLFERRVGVDQAAISDPERALPFLRAEEDYWAASLGVELLPEGAPYRFAARAELRDGDFLSTRLVSFRGQVTLNRSLSLLSRQEFLQRKQERARAPDFSRRRSTLWGLAFRPAASEKLVLLGKFQWLDDRNPIGGGVLTAEGRESRLIGIAEAIWEPRPGVELAGRYAARFTESEVAEVESGPRHLESRADYLGARLRVDPLSWLSLGATGRLLVERSTSTRRWDVAPSVFLNPFNLLELEVGYRIGDLRDPDFAVRGGPGAFLVLGARLTQNTLRSGVDLLSALF